MSANPLPRPIAKRIDVVSRAVAFPGIQLGLGLQLLPAAGGYHDELTRHLGKRRHVAKRARVGQVIEWVIAMIGRRHLHGRGVGGGEGPQQASGSRRSAAISADQRVGRRGSRLGKRRYAAKTASGGHVGEWLIAMIGR